MRSRNTSKVSTPVPDRDPDVPGRAEAVDELGLSPAALAIVAERYLRRDLDGRMCESTAGMMDRVARFVARAEDAYRHGSSEYWAQRFAALLRDREFLPNSPTLMNAGAHAAVLSGCFVLPLEDSLDSILTTLHTTALLHRCGAGTGFTFSHLRPRGARVFRSSRHRRVRAGEGRYRCVADVQPLGRGDRCLHGRLSRRPAVRSGRSAHGPGCPYCVRASLAGRYRGAGVGHW